MLPYVTIKIWYMVKFLSCMQVHIYNDFIFLIDPKGVCELWSYLNLVWPSSIPVVVLVIITNACYNHNLIMKIIDHNHHYFGGCVVICQCITGNFLLNLKKKCKNIVMFWSVNYLPSISHSGFRFIDWWVNIAWPISS